jgi:hypothetical protein
MTLLLGFFQWVGALGTETAVALVGFNEAWIHMPPLFPIPRMEPVPLPATFLDQYVPRELYYKEVHRRVVEYYSVHITYYSLTYVGSSSLEFLSISTVTPELSPNNSPNQSFSSGGTLDSNRTISRRFPTTSSSGFGESTSGE